VLTPALSVVEVRSQGVLVGAMAATNSPLAQVDTSELAKADGALTCCSILIHKSAEAAPEK